MTASALAAAALPPLYWVHLKLRAWGRGHRTELFPPLGNKPGFHKALVRCRA